jgi:hypothetical protein
MLLGFNFFSVFKSLIAPARQYFAKQHPKSVTKRVVALHCITTGFSPAGQLHHPVNFITELRGRNSNCVCDVLLCLRRFCLPWPLEQIVRFADMKESVLVPPKDLIDAEPGIFQGRFPGWPQAGVERLNY